MTTNTPKLPNSETPPHSRSLTYAQAVNEALHESLSQDPHMICYGLGTPDPKGVFGTTLGLQERFGQQRVFDMPCSENAMTGVAIGAALNGIRSVVTHQRVDFFLLAMDQLVNNAAKWHYMFGGEGNVPITIRLVIGRGWGQGPTHSQHLQAWFTHIPGLKVVMPTTPADAKGLLISSVFDDNPVVFLEHRWLHNSEGDVPEGDHRVPLGEARVAREGNDVTLVAMSHMTAEAIRAAEYLADHGVSCDVIDLRTLSPLDWNTVLESVRKTRRLIAMDTGSRTAGVAAEIVSRVADELGDTLDACPKRIALPDFPTPTSQAMTEDFYPGAREVVAEAAVLLKKSIPLDSRLERSGPQDVPGKWFKGPF